MGSIKKKAGEREQRRLMKRQPRGQNRLKHGGEHAQELKERLHKKEKKGRENKK